MSTQGTPEVENVLSSRYDRTSTGWDIPWVKTRTRLDDGTEIVSSHFAQSVPRPPEERVRCGPYKDPNTGGDSWGDHRVTFRGTTCEEVQCHVPHAVNVYPGWSEPLEDGENFFERPGIHAIAAALEGWDAGGMMRERIGTNNAWIAADVVLDALRDAGYELVEKDGSPS